MGNNADCVTIQCPPPVQICPVWVLSAALSPCFSCQVLFGDPSSVPLRRFVPHERCSWDELQLPSELMSVPGAAGQWVSVTLWGEGRPSAWGGPPSYCRDQLLSRRGDHPTVYSRLVVSDMLLLCGWDSDSQLCLYHLFTWNWQTDHLQEDTGSGHCVQRRSSRSRCQDFIIQAGFCQDGVAAEKSQINMFLGLFGSTGNFSPEEPVCVVTQLTFSFVWFKAFPC